MTSKSKRKANKEFRILPEDEVISPPDIQQIIDECRSKATKDGLSWNRLENIENCF